MSKIIFLDIDGVLAVQMQERDEYGSLFHPRFEQNLKRIIDETGAYIVVSSTWRHSGLEVLKEMWCKRGLPGTIIDITPILRFDKQTGDNVPRGYEIRHWLDTCHRIDLLDDGIDSYVILDDDTDMLLSQANNFVQCSGNMDDEDCEDCGYGLTNKCTLKAIQILNK